MIHTLIKASVEDGNHYNNFWHWSIK
jgi:hypothetical protein